MEQRSSFILAGLWMTAAYFVAGAFVAGLILGEQASLAAGFAVSIKDIPVFMASFCRYYNSSSSRFYVNESRITRVSE